MTAARVLFDQPGPRGRARIRVFTILGLVLLACSTADGGFPLGVALALSR